MDHPHGLSARTVDLLREVLTRHDAVEEAVLFGSRAKGNFKPGSDIDLALVGARLDERTMNRIAGEIDDLPIPYELSLVLFNNTLDPALRVEIERVGVRFYLKASATPASPT